MLDGFTITIAFIILSTVVAAFVRRRKRDKCLKDFASDMVTLEDTSGEIIMGTLNVENTGLEFVYPAGETGESGNHETSTLLYKHEYPRIQVLVRYHDQLSDEGKKEREKELERTYHPGFFRRLERRIQNVFKTIRDSVAEVVNILISRAKQATPAGGVLTSQDKYVSQMKQGLMDSAGTSYEPLLEKYIGHKVVLELVKGDEALKYRGILKDYTANFVELMDVDHKGPKAKNARKADIVVLRKYGVVRHLGE